MVFPTLDEEGETDKLLSELAEGQINLQAADAAGISGRAR